MELEKDFKEFIELLNEHKVKYLAKKETGRLQDLADAEQLEKLLKNK